MTESQAKSSWIGKLGVKAGFLLLLHQLQQKPADQRHCFIFRRTVPIKADLKRHDPSHTLAHTRCVHRIGRPSWREGVSSATESVAAVDEQVCKSDKTINCTFFSTNLGKTIEISNDLWYDFWFIIYIFSGKTTYCRNWKLIDLALKFMGNGV